MNALHISLLLLAVVGTTVSALDVSKKCPQSKKCMETFTDAMMQKNFTRACSELSKAKQCYSDLEKTCPDFANDFSTTEIEISDDEMKAGCDGKCGAASEPCFSSLVSLVRSDSQYDLKVCSSVAKAFTCMENINSTQCSAQEKLAMTYFGKAMKQQYFGDICDDKGNPSKCFNASTRCTKNLDSVKPSTSNDTACTNARKFVECIDGLTCKDALEGTIGNKLRQIKTQHSCPDVKTCRERVGDCASTVSSQLAKFKDDKTNRDEICKDLKGAVDCIDKVRTDPICDLEKAYIGSSEDQAKAYNNAECSNNATCSNKMYLCASNAAAAMSKFQTDKGNKDAICKDMKSALKCFDTNRKDTKCSKLEKKIQGVEDETKSLTDKECGGASSVVISTALMALGIAISVFKNYI